MPRAKGQLNPITQDLAEAVERTGERRSLVRALAAVSADTTAKTTTRLAAARHLSGAAVGEVMASLLPSRVTSTETDLLA